MISMIITAAAAVLCLCAVVSASEPLATTEITAVEGLSLAEISQAVETQSYWNALSSDTPFDLFGTWDDDSPEEARGKKPKPGKMAMAMAGSAAISMLMIKAITAIKLFIIHSFFATKLGLVIGAYLLLCKLAEMKQAPQPTKKVIKWVSSPPSHSHYDEPMSPMTGHYPDSGQTSYEPQQQQAAPVDEYGPPPASQNHHQQQQFMPSGDYGGGFGGDTQAHYSHVSPVTYRPMINRNQPENMAKSATGRV